jgi:hypothetical protein
VEIEWRAGLDCLGAKRPQCADTEALIAKVWIVPEASLLSVFGINRQEAVAPPIQI